MEGAVEGAVEAVAKPAVVRLHSFWEILFRERQTARDKLPIARTEHARMEREIDVSERVGWLRQSVRGVSGLAYRASPGQGHRVC